MNAEAALEAEQVTLQRGFLISLRCVHGRDVAIAIQVSRIQSDAVLDIGNGTLQFTQHGGPQAAPEPGRCVQRVVFNRPVEFAHTLGEIQLQIDGILGKHGPGHGQVRIQLQGTQRGALAIVPEIYASPALGHRVGCSEVFPRTSEARVEFDRGFQ